MSQEIYVKETPKDCWECPCQDNENGRCKILNRYADYIPKDCPLKSLHEHDKELARKIFNRIIHLASLQNNDNLYVATVCIVEEVQKEFEK